MFYMYLYTCDDRICDYFCSFTCEREQNSQLPFLDLQIFRTSSGNFSFSVYRKPTHTGNYLKFQSNHPKCHKRAVVKSLTDRAKKLCSADNLEGK